MNKENLLKACDWIEANVNGSQWNFSDFRTKRFSGGYVYADFISKKECGAHGCFIGWCPFVPGLEEIKEDFFPDNSLDFIRYGMRITGLSKNDFDWLFLPDSYTSPNPEKAVVIGRVRYFVRVFCKDSPEKASEPKKMRE